MYRDSIIIYASKRSRNPKRKIIFFVCVCLCFTPPSMDLIAQWNNTRILNVTSDCVTFGYIYKDLYAKCICMFVCTRLIYILCIINSFTALLYTIHTNTYTFTHIHTSYVTHNNVFMNTFL